MLSPRSMRRSSSLKVASVLAIASEWAPARLSATAATLTGPPESANKRRTARSTVVSLAARRSPARASTSLSPSSSALLITRFETIRYYERVALLPAPARSSGGYRLYGTDHLKRLTFIRRARMLGFSIGEVRTLLRLADERKRPCAEVRGVADAHLKDVRAKIADLRRMERVLKTTVARCASGQRAHCPVIEALYRDGSLRTA